MIGTVIGSYRLTEKLGDGGLGAVFRAVDPSTGREAAVRVFAAEVGRDPMLAERLRAMVPILKRLQHPNVGAVYDLVTVGTQLGFFLEYVSGANVEQARARTGRMDVNVAVSCAVQTLRGLEHAHGIGVYHHALRPTNLLVTPQGSVKVMDFGIGHALGANRRTREDRLLSVLSYLAPEQIQNQPGDTRADIYAVGVILYELLVGKLPFEHRTEFALRQAHLNEPPVLPRFVVAGIPDWVEQAVMRALAKNPSQRFQNATEMRAVLEAGLGLSTSGSAAVVRDAGGGGAATTFSAAPPIPPPGRPNADATVAMPAVVAPPMPGAAPEPGAAAPSNVLPGRLPVETPQPAPSKPAPAADATIVLQRPATVGGPAPVIVSPAPEVLPPPSAVVDRPPAPVPDVTLPSPSEEKTAPIAAPALPIAEATLTGPPPVAAVPAVDATTPAPAAGAGAKPVNKADRPAEPQAAKAAVGKGAAVAKPAEKGKPAAPAKAAGGAKRGLGILALVGVLVILAGAAAGFYWLKFVRGAVPEEAPAAVDAANQAPAGAADAGVPAATPPAEVPAAAPPAETVPPPVSTVPPAPVKALPPAPKRAPRTQTAAPPPAAPPAAQPAAVVPPPEPVVTPAPKPARAPEPDVPLPELSFRKVKIVTQQGETTREIEVALMFLDDRVGVSPAAGGATFRSVKYSDIVSASYARAQKKRLFIKSSKHLLTIETAADPLVLRLDNANFEPIIKALEARSKKTVER